MTFHETEWMLSGACRGHDSEVWFSSAPEAVEYAKAVCSACVVRLRCQDYALADPALTTRETGIWGGLTDDERRRIKRKRRLMAQRERSA